MTRILRAGRRFLTSANYRFIYMANLGRYNTMPDEEYLIRMFKAVMGTELDLEHPVTFNEKLQWLKLYDRNPLYTTMVDKYEVKKYVADIIGEEYIIPTLGVWDDPDEIDFEKLPNQFVLKCNHNSGLGMCICKDKSKLNYDKVRADLRKGLAQDYYLLNREWPYKDVPRKIIAEKYLSDNLETELANYKVHNFSGIPQMILVCRDRFAESGLTEDFFDAEWHHLPILRITHPNASIPVKKPITFDKMLELAKKLSKDIPFLRTDFYEVGDKLYFGELTLYPASGFSKFEPNAWDKKYGDLVELPNNIGGYLVRNDNFCLWMHIMPIHELVCDDQQKREIGTEGELTDYKLMCFNGKVKCSFVCSERFSGSGLKVTFFDTDWNIMPFERHYPQSKNPLKKPKSYNTMVGLAEKLARDIPFARVDFYEVQGKIYFGEITFFPGSGLEEFTPSEWDEHLGKWIKLDEIKS